MYLSSGLTIKIRLMMQVVGPGLKGYKNGGFWSNMVTLANSSIKIVGQLDLWLMLSLSLVLL